MDTVVGDLAREVREAPHPIPDSYWVVPGRLLAGEYPGAPGAEAAERKLRRLGWSGIDLYVDLTEEGEYGLRQYADLLDGAEHLRLPIPDVSTPSRERMTEILDTIDEALDSGRSVYVHCYGGIGRTGTVVGCHLVRHGATGEEALDRIAELRRGTPDGSRESPETAEQRELVPQLEPRDHRHRL